MTVENKCRCNSLDTKPIGNDPEFPARPFNPFANPQCPLHGEIISVFSKDEFNRSSRLWAWNFRQMKKAILSGNTQMAGKHARLVVYWRLRYIALRNLCFGKLRTLKTGLEKTI